MLSKAQKRALTAYEGDVLSAVVKAGEYEDESRNGYACTVTMSTGWVVVVGRYGGVLSEAAPSTPSPAKIVDVALSEDGEASSRALGWMVLVSVVLYGAVIGYALVRGFGVELLSMACVPLPWARASSQDVAAWMSESNEGAPWVSYGDVAVDEGTNAYVVDREETCYLRTADLLAWHLSIWAPDAKVYAYSATLPAYNAWWVARRCGLRREDYGRTWWLYSSQSEYLESLS